MAIYTVSVLIQDEQGRQTNREVLFDETDEASLLARLVIFIPAYQAVMKSGIVQYAYRREVAVNNVPAAGSNIDAGASVLWNTSLTIDPTTKFPDPVEAIKDGQGGIDLSSVEMIAWANEYLVETARVNSNNPTQPTSIRRATLDK
jgi:hypothetical protein